CASSHVTANPHPPLPATPGWMQGQTAAYEIAGGGPARETSARALSACRGWPPPLRPCTPPYRSGSLSPEALQEAAAVPHPGPPWRACATIFASLVEPAPPLLAQDRRDERRVVGITAPT